MPLFLSAQTNYCFCFNAPKTTPTTQHEATPATSARSSFDRLLSVPFSFDSGVAFLSPSLAPS